ncbi:MAG: hypothetical protein ACXVRJ_12900 [Gaiellaceae bacterium]
MNTSRNTRLAVGAAVVALAATGAAVAATKLKGTSHQAGSSGLGGTLISSGSGSSSGSGFEAGHRFGGRGGPGGMMGHHGDDLAAAAAYLGLTESDLATKLQAGKTLAQVADATSGKSASGLIDALVTHDKAELAQAVKDGKLTQAQADQIGTNLKQRITDQVNHTGGPGGPGMHGHGPGDDFAAAATYLGISQSDLVTQLQAGKTLGQIADATSGKSKAGLVAALVAAEKTELAQAVKDGRLTQAQADQLTATLQDRFTQMVDGTFPSHHDGPPVGPSSGGPSTQPQHI